MAAMDLGVVGVIVVRPVEMAKRIETATATNPNQAMEVVPVLVISKKLHRATISVVQVRTVFQILY